MIAFHFIMTANAFAEEIADNPFFAISFGFREETMSERVEFLTTAGYDGIAAFVFNEKTLSEFSELMTTPEVQGGKFQVFGVYMPVNMDNQEQRYLVTKVLEIGKPRNAPIWLTIQNADASEKAVVAYVSDLCDEALKSGTDVILYPHDRHYATYAERTLEIIEKANKPNLYTSLHLNHELRAGNAHRLEEVIKKAAPFARLASVSGANAPGDYNRGSRDWSDVVQELKVSVFDAESFYKLLRKYGYDGPIGYNNWKIPGDVKERHKRTLAIYRSWAKSIAPKQIFH